MSPGYPGLASDSVFSGRERPQEVSVTLHPATADNRDEQFVRMTLTLHLPADYPCSSPKVSRNAGNT